MSTKNFGLFNLQLFADLPDAATIGAEEGAVKINGESTETAVVAVDADSDTISQIVAENYTPAASDTAQVDGVTYTYDGANWTYETTTQVTTTETADAEIVTQIIANYYSGGTEPGDGDTADVDGVTYTYDGANWTYKTTTQVTTTETADAATVSEIEETYYSPADGDTAEVGSVTYTYNGTTWLYDTNYTVVDYYNFSAENTVDSDTTIAAEGEEIVYDNVTLESGSVVNGGGLSSETLTLEGIGDIKNFDAADAVTLTVQDDELKLTGVTGTVELDLASTDGTFEQTINGTEVSFDIDSYDESEEELMVTISGSSSSNIPVIFTNDDLTLNSINNLWVLTRESGYQLVKYEGAEYLVLDSNTVMLSSENDVISFYVSEDAVVDFEGASDAYVNDTLIGGSALDDGRLYTNSYGSLTYMNYTDSGTIYVGSTYEGGTADVTTNSRVVINDVDGTPMITSINRLALGGSWTTDLDTVRFGVERWYFSDEDTTLVADEESGTKVASVAFTGQATLEARYSSDPLNTGDININDAATIGIVSLSSSDTAIFAEDGSTTLNGSLIFANVKEGSVAFADTNEGSLKVADSGTVLVSDYKLAGASQVEGGSEINTKSTGFLLASQAWSFDDEDGVTIVADDSGTEVAAITFDGNATLRTLALEGESTSPIGITSEVWTADVTINDETTWFSAGTSISDTVVFEDDGDITLDGDLAMALLKDGDNKTVSDANEGSLTLVEGAVAVVSDSKLAWATQVEGGSDINTKNEAFFLGTEGWAFDDTDTKVITANESGTKATAVYFEGQASLGSFTTESITDTVSGEEITLWTSDRVSINSAAQWQVAGETVSDTAIFDEDGDIMLDADSMMMAELASGTSKTVADTNGGSLTLVEGGVVIASETNLIAASAVEGGSDINTKSEVFLLGTQGWAFDDTDTKVITANESGTAAAAVTFTGNATLGSFATESFTDSVSGAEVTAWNADRVSINSAAQWQVAGETVSDTAIFDEDGDIILDADSMMMAELASGTSKTVADTNGGSLTLVEGGVVIASETNLIAASAVEGGSDINTKSEVFLLGTQGWAFDDTDTKVITANESGTAAAAVTFTGNATLGSFATESITDTVSGAEVTAWNADRVSINSAAQWQVAGETVSDTVIFDEDGNATLDADSGYIMAALANGDSKTVTDNDGDNLVLAVGGLAVADSETGLVGATAVEGGSDINTKGEGFALGSQIWAFDNEDEKVITADESGTKAAAVTFTGNATLGSFATESFTDTVSGAEVTAWNADRVSINGAAQWQVAGETVSDTVIFDEDGNATLDADGGYIMAALASGTSKTVTDNDGGSLTLVEGGVAVASETNLIAASAVEGDSEITTKSEGFALGSQAWDFSDGEGEKVLTADESGTKVAAITFDGTATMHNYDLEEATSPIGITSEAWTADVTVNEDTTWFAAGTTTSDTVVFEDDGDITLDGDLAMALLKDGDNKTVNDANEGSLTLVEGAVAVVSDSKLAWATQVEGGSDIVTKSDLFVLKAQGWVFDSEGEKVLTADDSGTEVAAITFDGNATLRTFALEESTSPIGITSEVWTADVTINDETTWFSAGTSISDTVVFEDDGNITLDGDLAMALLKDGDSKNVNDADGGALTLVEGAVAVVSDSKLAWATQVEGGSYIVTKNEAFLLGTQGWAFDDTDTKVITANESGTKATAVYFEGQASLGSFTTESITDTVSGEEVTAWTSDRVSINGAAQWQVAGETVSDTVIFDEDGNATLDADSGYIMAALANGDSKTVTDNDGDNLVLAAGGLAVADSETGLVGATAVEGGSDINTKGEGFALGSQIWAFDDTDTKVITANESGTAAAAVTFTGNATLGSFATESITDSVSGAEITAWNADRVSINSAAQWQVAGETVSDTVVFDEDGNATLDADSGYIMAALANGDSKTVTDNDGDNLVLAAGGLMIADSETGLVGATAVEGGSDINTKGEGFALGSQIWAFDNEDEKVITADESGTAAAAVTFNGNATLRSFTDDFDGESVNINDKATWTFSGDDYLNVVSIAEDGAVTLDGADNGAIAASLVSASDTESLEVTIADTGDVVKLSEGGAVAGFDFSGTSIVAVNSLAGGSDWSVKADMIVVGEIDSSSDTKEGTAVIFGDGDESGLKGVVTVNESGTDIVEISDLSDNVLYSYADEKIDGLTVAGKTWSVENDINKAVMFSAEGDITVDGGFDSDAWIADAEFDYLSVNGDEGAKVFLAANNSVGMADFNVTTTNATSTGVIDNADFASVLFMQDADGIEVELEAAGSGTGITAINGVDTGADVWVAYDREFTVNDIATVKDKTDSRSIETIAMTITEDGMNVNSLVDSANYDIDGVDVNYGFAAEHGYYASETKVTIGSAQVTVTTASADDLDNVTIASPDGDDIATVSGLKISNSIDIEGDDSYVLVYDNDKADSYEQVTFGGGDIAITARGAVLDDEVTLTVDGSNVTIGGVDEGVTLRATTGTYKTDKGTADTITEETGYLFVDEYGNIEAINQSVIDEYETITQIEKDAFEATSDTTVPASAITYGDAESTTATVSSSEPVNISSDIAENVVVEGSNFVVIGANEATAPVEGNHTVFGADAESTIVFGANADGRNVAIAGDGNTLLYNNGNGKSTLIGGAGDDTVIASDKDYVEGGDGADVFVDTGDYTIGDYSAADGDVIVATMVDDVTDILGAIDTNEGTISVGNGNITLDGATASEGYKATVFDSDAESSVNLAWASKNGSTIDASDFANENGVLANVAQENYLDMDGGHADSIKGSDYADFIIAGNGDTVDAGAGDDYIMVTDTSEAGAVVALSEGNDTVLGWNFGYDNVDEGANVLDADATALTYSTDDAGNIKVSDDNGSMTFMGTTETGIYQLLVGDDKVAFINGENATIDNLNDTADVYVGNDEATLTFSENITDTLSLTNDGKGGLNNLVVKNENGATIVGADVDEVVEVGGSAANDASKIVSLGGGDDLIISSGDSKDNAANAFYFGSADDNDTVSNINFVSSADDDETGDVIAVEQNATVSSIDGNNVILSTSDSSDTTVTLVDAKGQNFAVYNPNNEISFIAQVGTDSVSFDGVADYFYASEENASVTVAEGVENAEIWLNNTSDLNKAYFDGDFAYLDASNVTGEAILVGESGDNTIIGGQGQSSLWGGYESNSELIGGEGEDSFMLFNNTGNTANVTNFDTDEDMVWLYDYSLDDFTEEVAIDADSITMNFNDGSSMTVNTASGKDLNGMKVKVADGENSWTTYTANTSTGKWE